LESGRPTADVDEDDGWFRRGDTDDERCGVTGLGGVDPEAPCDETLPRWNSDGARHTARLLADI